MLKHIQPKIMLELLKVFFTAFLKNIERIMREEGRNLLDRKVIDWDTGYKPSDIMEIKVVTHGENGEKLWSSHDDNPLSVVRKFPLTLEQ